MKRFNSIMLSTLAIISLASCEMKNEIWGDTTGKREKGTLELGVSVKEPPFFSEIPPVCAKLQYNHLPATTDWRESH